MELPTWRGTPSPSPDPRGPSRLARQSCRCVPYDQATHHETSHDAAALTTTSSRGCPCRRDSRPPAGRLSSRRG